VALDDLQWLDPSSATVLQIALRRLREEPVGVFATARDAPEAGLDLAGAFAGERLTRLSPSPLGPTELRSLLKARLSLELSRSELTRVLDASGGNPFFALELSRELARTGARHEAGQGLHLPEGLHELLGVRLARLPAETADVLLTAATAARPTVEVLTAVHGEREETLDALDLAVREGGRSPGGIPGSVRPPAADAGLLRAGTARGAALGTPGAGRGGPGRRGTRPPPCTCGGRA
jgi:predicted ATPase